MSALGPALKHIVDDAERRGYAADDVAALLIGVGFGVLENEVGRGAAEKRARAMLAEALSP